MKNKKSQSIFMRNIYYIIFALAIFALLLLFIKNAEKKDNFKKQITAKQAALLLDAAEANTAISLQHANLTISLKENSTIETKTQLSFLYSFFNPHEVNIVSKEGATELKIA